MSRSQHAEAQLLTAASQVPSIVCLKKVSTFKLSVTLSNLNDFHNFFTPAKHTKFATKPIQHYPPHCRFVATQPWEIKHSNFLPIFSTCGKNANKFHIYRL